jgi:hypothetical protein
MYTYVSFFSLSFIILIRLDLARNKKKIKKMASKSNVGNDAIENIKMDHFGGTEGRVAIIGVGPCICFLIILNNGQELFLEHRSDIFFLLK